MRVRGKNILLRVDFNWPYEYRVAKTIPAVRALLKNGAASVILITHCEKDDKIIHLDSLHKYLRKFFKDIVFVKGPIKKMPEAFFDWYKNRVVLLDNLRFSPGEQDNTLVFAKILASWGDYYVNDAFAASHREHASIVLLPKLLPHEVGPLFKKEVENLSKFFKPRHPFLVVIAGNKFATKEPLISKFIKTADAVFVGGAIGNAFLKKRGVDIGRSRVENTKIPKNILWHRKILLPEDWVTKNGVIYDAGPNTVKELVNLAKNSKLILWNGTLGLCEKGFTYGTQALALGLGRSKAYKVVGGGDTVAVIRKMKLEKNFDFISTGGGAMLEFLANGTLPGIAALGEPRLRREPRRRA